MKHNRLLGFLCLLVCVSLACDIPMEIEKLLGGSPSTGPVQIESITVSPASGSGHFSATVKYSYNNGDGIRCYVDTGEHDDELALSHGLEGSAGSTSEPFTFDFTKPGQHTLTCTGYSGNSSASTDFTVTSGPESQAPSGGPLEITGTGTVTVLFSYNGNSCSMPAKAILLTVNPNNSATLRVDYFVPNLDCTPDTNNTTLPDRRTIVGTADPANGAVNLTGTSDTATDCPSRLAYTSETIKGEVTCQGGDAIKITMP